MKMTDVLLDELDREANMTCRVLEEVPAGRKAWQPHAKSLPLGYLAALVAKLPSRVAVMIHQDQYDLASFEDAKYRPLPLGTSRELLQLLNVSVAEAREVLKSTSDEHLMAPYRLLVSRRVVAELPLHQAIRHAVFSRLAHHRGQLTVYLRLNEASIPPIYGAAPDEDRM